MACKLRVKIDKQEEVSGTISGYLNNIFSDGELEENSVCRKFRRTGPDGKVYNTKFYNIENKKYL